MSTSEQKKSELQPGFIRRKIGAFEVTALLDGYSEAVCEQLVIGYDAERAKEMRRDVFMSETGSLIIPISTFLVDTGHEKILIDAGAARSWNETTGNLVDMLAAAGVSTDEVDKLLFTHLHPDHVLGATDDQGNKVFANAEFVVPEIEQKFWSDDTYMTPQREPVFTMARNAMGAYSDKIVPIASEGEVLPGIQAVHMPGHTPGHTGYVISSGQDSLFIIADIIHVAAVQFAEPNWGVVFDADKEQAIETRKKILDQVATDRTLIAGMHLPFPGFGYVARHGNGYRFVPAGWQYR